MLEAIVVVVIVVLDQFTKHLTDLYLSPLGTSVPLWEGVFHITSAHNRGAAFGMLQGGRWIFLAVTLIACIGIIYVLIKYKKQLHKMLRVCLVLILAGALGNFIDRVFLGYVRDMLDFRLIEFAVFNVADSAVSIGSVLLALDIFFGKNRALYDGLGSKDKHAGEAKGGEHPSEISSPGIQHEVEERTQPLEKTNGNS